MPISVPEKVKAIDVDVVLLPLGTVVLLPSIGVSILADGGVVSTVHVNNSAVASLFPELSSALTLNVCEPSLNKLGNPNGLVHITKSELSMLHSNRFIPASPASVPENVNVMEFERVLLSLVRLFLLLSRTESIEVVGGKVSIVQLKNAGDESRFTTLSSALTSNA